jgi:hypothetical protein
MDDSEFEISPEQLFEETNEVLCQVTVFGYEINIMDRFFLFSISLEDWITITESSSELFEYTQTFDPLRLRVYKNDDESERKKRGKDHDWRVEFELIDDNVDTLNMLLKEYLNSVDLGKSMEKFQEVSESIKSPYGKLLDD